MIHGFPQFPVYVHGMPPMVVHVMCFNAPETAEKRLQDDSICAPQSGFILPRVQRIRVLLMGREEHVMYAVATLDSATEVKHIFVLMGDAMDTSAPCVPGWCALPQLAPMILEA